ncbi:MAG: formate dehydrogenase subunit alpha [Acidobacteria bacterium RIFCSPLOWO2_02_FULL_65_29]|nr:MAG: formate dehydrogenase subunit alpha [Acidobacteria bacterium RIFCSPLOWO2_02_FULL_65_29]
MIAAPVAGAAPTLSVEVNGAPDTLPAGATILDALRAAGVHLPTLCHDERLTPIGVCRLCLVRVQGWARAVPACSTPLLDGMRIETNARDLEDARRTALTLLARRYPADGVERDPHKEFHRAILEHGLERELLQASAPGPIDRSHPYIAVDMSRCIDCYRCVRICDEVQGQFVWHVRDRGLDTQIVPDGPSLFESSCVGCGACVDTCPTGALDDAARSRLGAASAWTNTTCPYCGVGCEMSVGARDGRIVAVKPVLDAPVNKGHLCVKGRYAFEFVGADDRVLDPMIRTGGQWRCTSWDEALTFAAARLGDLVARHGPDSVGVLGSARATNEENYLAQKFARVVLGTNNVDCCARVCHAPSAAALKHSLGTGLGTNSFDDIEIARTILVCGANPTENHPVVGARIKQAVRRGAALIVVDPRRIELASLATCHLAVRPGTNVPLLNAMAHAILAKDLVDRRFLEARVDGVETFARSVEAWTPERAAVVCGVDAELIRRAARLYATRAPAMSIHGLGLTEHVQGTDGVTLLINLALLTGNIGKPGTGINPLRGQNNVQGAAHMGCEPNTLPGAASPKDGRAVFEQAWKREIPSTHGLHLLHMMDAALDGRFNALWTIGYDVLLTNANASETVRAMRALDLVIVQDLFLTETAREVGSVFFPACSSLEKDGTFMNAERRIQRVRQVVRPLGQSRPDWRIICDLARAMGHGELFDFREPEAIWNEVRALCEGARGMSYARLDRGGLQWPCPSEDHPGTSILHRDSFAAGPRAVLHGVAYQPSRESTGPEYPFVLNTGRSLYQFNAGTMTGRTPNNALRPSDLLDMCPDDADRLGLSEGDTARVISRYGSAVLPVRLNAGVQPGQLFATFHTPSIFLNSTTGSHRDGATGTPEYKVAAVRVERTA